MRRGHLPECIQAIAKSAPGDSWGLVSVPVIEKRPEYTIIFICIVVSVSLGVMNLILAVIVESAAEARESDLAQKHKTQKKEVTVKNMRGREANKVVYWGEGR